MLSTIAIFLMLFAFMLACVMVLDIMFNNAEGTTKLKRFIKPEPTATKPDNK